jgi:DNA-binding CsgD family transcriptional regulator
MGVLLERDRELRRIAELLGRCADGHGGIVVIDGPAGIGKTALLEAAVVSAQAAGIVSLTARGGVLERGFGYSVVRDLFAPALGAEGLQRTELLTGAAGLAARVIVLEPSTAPPPTADPAFAVVHGLYWLTANLARRGPLLLAIDDAHWCDPPSLRFLSYLARRLEGLPVAMLLAGRPTGQSGLLDAIIAEALTTVLEPDALSVAGVGQLVRGGLGDPDDRFVLACHDATTGNPFLTAELVRELARTGVAPSAEETRRVSELRPPSIRRAIVTRLARLPDAAREMAQAVAVLGAGSQLRDAAALAELPLAAAAPAVDTLVAVEILKPQLPLDFVHPIVRAAVYDELAPVLRTAAHSRAARVLAQADAEPGEVAAHLLACEPEGEAWVVQRLRTAADTALAHGAPEGALVYVERALLERPEASERAVLLFELGRLQATVRDPRALGTLEESLVLCEEPGLRLEVANLLFVTLVFAGQWDAAIALVDAELRDLDGHDPEASIRLETMRAITAAYDPGLVDRFDSEHARLQSLADRGGTPGRSLSLLLAANAAWRNRDGAEALALVRRGLDGGRLLEEEGAEGWAFGQAMTALIALDELDEAEELADAMLVDASRRGSVMGMCAASSFSGYVHARRGRLRHAEAQLRVGFSLAIEHQVTFGLPSLLSYAIDAIPERPGLADLAEAVEQIALPPAFEATASGALLLDARGRLRIQRGEIQAAIVDLERCAAIFTATHLTNPALSCWRSTLALAVRKADPDRALQLVDEELRLARELGKPRPIGVALRAAGLVAGGEHGLGQLRDAVAMLERCPSTLEQARGLTALGGALRRAGRRAEARDRLRAGLSLARASGAERLAEQADHELRAAGAKPRRHAFSGVESLTASELRIAEMAAAELTNQQVAEALFITAKTVENHLGRVYQKLGIHSRGRLAAALGKR